MATSWHIGDLRPRCGVVSARSPAVGGGRFTATILGDQTAGKLAARRRIYETS